MNPASTTRRDFLSCAALFVLGARPLARIGSYAPAALRIALVDDDATHDARGDGALLGVEEARHAAALFGGTVTLARVAPNAALPPETTAVIGDGDAARCAAMIRDVGRSGVLFMNVACSSDELRGAGCSATAFHIAPSDAMRRAAASQAGGEQDAVAWDPSLERFGADTLNQRFHTRFGRDMTAEAWAAWMAVKVLWEASLRVRSVSPAAIAAYLAGDTTQFDGHKGRPLSFRPWDHQLRQPLYVRKAGTIIEVPVARAEESSRDALDRLGTTKAETRCALAR